jgi:pyruvate dehydrogenase E1 component alpha subunit
MDPIETLNTLTMSLEIQEKSGKPVFIEVFNNRYLEHCGPNDDSDLGYRSVVEVEAAIDEDPLPKLEHHLRQLKVSDEEFANINNQIEIEIMRAFEFAENSPLANLPLNDEDVFCE